MLLIVLNTVITITKQTNIIAHPLRSCLHQFEQTSKSCSDFAFLEPQYPLNIAYLVVHVHSSDELISIKAKYL